MRSACATVLAATAVATLLAGCGTGSRQARPPAASTPATPTTTASIPAAPSASAPPSTRAAPSSRPATPIGPRRIDKLLVVVVENHSLDEMRREMPWTFALGRRYGYATGFRALAHPSLPNYLAMSGGDTFGVGDDHDPSAHPLGASSVFGQALAAGRTAKVYAEGMPGPCVLTNAGRYAVRHNPWTYYVRERAACLRYDVPMAALPADVRASRLPNAGMLVPDMCSDAHDCPAATADAWLRRVLGDVMSGPDFRSGRLLVVVTADEDDKTQGNLVLTTLVNPQLAHAVVTAPLDHYSLARLYAEVLGVPPLRRARSAPSMVRAFGLLAGPAH